MNGGAFEVDESERAGRAAVQEYRSSLTNLRTRHTMTSGMTAFMVVAGGTSLALIGYLLMSRVQHRKMRRESVSDGTYYGTSVSDTSSTDSWNLFSWGGSDSSSHNSASSSDGGGDSGGGGGDGGGGD